METLPENSCSSCRACKLEYRPDDIKLFHAQRTMSADSSPLCRWYITSKLPAISKRKKRRNWQIQWRDVKLFDDISEIWITYPSIESGNVFPKWIGRLEQIIRINGEYIASTTYSHSLTCFTSLFSYWVSFYIEHLRFVADEHSNIGCRCDLWAWITGSVFWNQFSNRLFVRFTPTVLSKTFVNIFRMQTFGIVRAWLKIIDDERVWMACW
jgi:hypothetical protein